MDKREWQVESSVHNFRKVIWTHCDILWTCKFFNNILNNDKQDFSELNQYWECNEFHWWCYSGNKGRERYGEVVEEVVKMLAENDLYVKLEKCKWKMREVGFLEVVIGPEEIKMEEEKMKWVLE